MIIKFITLSLIVCAILGAMFFYTNKSQAEEGAAKVKANHLADSFSPYLRQHIYNPVNWYEWGDEAIERAKVEGKPILVSIGYSTCYWCHVLEREVFMSKDAAAIMNENFINIKVDREVRPDLDKIYMVATQALTGGGGWPNNLFLTPDLKPFYATTYAPKKDWIKMTQKIASLWDSDERSRLENQADNLSNMIRNSLFAAPSMVDNISDINVLAQSVLQEKISYYDRRYGGFGTGMKFPQESGLLFLLDLAKNKYNSTALNMVKSTVDHMLLGGIHDHVGGGFHRYSTDIKWQIPHFEKMLYNQAMMSIVLAHLYEHTNEPRYKRALIRLLDYVDRDMSDKNGGFYSAQDAETDAVEGAYYVWNYSDLNNAISSDEFTSLMSIYSTTYPPYSQGHKAAKGAILYQGQVVSSQEQQVKIDKALDKLLTARQKRKAPLRDEKILSAWNGMMIYGLAEAARVLKDDSYAKKGEKAVQYILNNMRADNGRLYRISMEGKPHQNAFLEDYAWLARALVALYAYTGNDTYKEEAVKLIETADSYLLDKKSGGYYMSDISDNFFVRIKEGAANGALPSGNSVMAHVFSALYLATGDQKWKSRFDDLVHAFGSGISSEPRGYDYMIAAMMNTESFKKTEVTPVIDGNSEIAKSDEKDLMQSKDLESKDKVSVKAYLMEKGSSDKRKIIRVEIQIDYGWHINANPASMDFLIPTVIDIQGGEDSSLKVSYPNGRNSKTPLGVMSVYDGRVNIISVLKSRSPIETSQLRALIQVQACKEATCYPPSQISVPVE